MKSLFLGLSSRQIVIFLIETSVVSSGLFVVLALTVQLLYS